MTSQPDYYRQHRLRPVITDVTRAGLPDLSQCRHWIGPERRHCLSTDGIRRYILGPRCPLHTPAALAGKPEAPAVNPPKWRHLFAIRNDNDVPNDKDPR